MRVPKLESKSKSVKGYQRFANLDLICLGEGGVGVFCWPGHKQIYWMGRGILLFGHNKTPQKRGGKSFIIHYKHSGTAI